MSCTHVEQRAAKQKQRESARRSPVGSASRGQSPVMNFARDPWPRRKVSLKPVAERPRVCFRHRYTIETGKAFDFSRERGRGVCDLSFHVGQVVPGPGATTSAENTDAGRLPAWLRPQLPDVAPSPLFPSRYPSSGRSRPLWGGCSRPRSCTTSSNGGKKKR